MKKLAITAVACIFSVASWAAPISQTQQNNFNATQTHNIEQIVKNYLLKNPKILIAMSQALKQQQQQDRVAQLQNTTNIIKQNKESIFDGSSSPIAGNKKGGITLIEFYDYQCGHCKVAAKNVKELIKNNKDLKVIYKDFPIFGGNSMTAAKFALAAYKISPKKYMKFHDAMMRVQGALTKEKIISLAKKASFNINDLERVSNSNEITKQLQQNKNIASLISLSGTPAFILGNKDLSKIQFFPGNYPIDSIQKIIDSMKTQ